MDIEGYIASGILENYCMGFCSETEATQVERYASAYPAIQQEIDKIRSVFEEYLLSNQIEPSRNVKFAVMENIYRQMATADPAYIPLLKENIGPAEIDTWIANNPVEGPDVAFDNVFMKELPSTPFVSNFMVWAKVRQDMEVHSEFNEYLYVVKGSCTMYFEDRAKHYSAGEIIYIPPHVHHRAVITSPYPMVAIVQRQMCA